MSVYVGGCLFVVRSFVCSKEELHTPAILSRRKRSWCEWIRSLKVLWKRKVCCPFLNDCTLLPRLTSLETESGAVARHSGSNCEIWVLSGLDMLQSVGVSVTRGTGWFYLDVAIFMCHKTINMSIFVLTFGVLMPVSIPSVLLGFGILSSDR